MQKIIYPEGSCAIVGACFNVYKDMSCGFLESVYQECAEMELTHRKIPFESQYEFILRYGGHELKHRFRLDLLCYGKIIHEVKAVAELVNEHRAQLINYLHATGLELGTLVNFGHYPKLEYERFVMSKGRAIYELVR